MQHVKRLPKHRRPWEDQRGVIRIGAWRSPTNVRLLPEACQGQGCEVHAGYVPLLIAYQMWHVGPDGVFESGPIEDQKCAQQRVDLWGHLVHAEGKHEYDASFT